ncbi:maintenance of telomere capping protein 1 [Lasiosphaeria miniovina]|uniref:Maintenance of telomere capping protein 1 n=1 Tax=Lasiosphaeria miniovina TaxID=1954250 RepID=A0AA40BJD8_9PEZI|nr:maintenance of telomere capping protein 1 [Lasiosphaeria miniovina]KAK0735242.1 maintenance of telomere capping protein 1 [Lasiosphaeria miniovina]
MASKRTKPVAPTDDELGELFEGIGDDAAPRKTAKPAPAKSKQPDDDILAELENELGDTTPARPHTPRVREAAPKTSLAKRASTNTPPPGADAPAATRKSADSTRSYHASFTPSATSSELQESERKAPVEPPQPAAAPSGGSWWGGLLSTATAAMKQAEAAVKEIQQNEEARKWADQVRGNVDTLKGLGDELRHRALPTFTNILHTLAPPISSHERLMIHITHDLAGYPSLDPLIYGVFNRVMAQVEGGDLLVIQRGQESSVRSPPASDKAGAGSFFAGQSAAGWRDGPWWRQADTPRDLGAVKGLVEGTKLCRANAEGYANDYFAAHGGIEGARQRAVEPVSESNPVRSSDLFLSVQALTVAADKGLFAGSTATEKDKADSAVLEEDDEDADGDLVCFAVFILDPVHEIQYSAVSQSVPARWIRWLDASAAPLPQAASEEGYIKSELDRVPDEIREIVEGGGVDPREWVAEWVEETLNLSVGVVAQRYVARRMGVGEGGIGKGKQKVEKSRAGDCGDR